jgi:putative transposase
VYSRDVLEGVSLEWTRLKSTRHAKYWCAYHFVLIPKYRRDILVGEFALCPPRHSPAYIANYLNGKSARRLLQKFPELKAKAEKLWGRSYFVATVGNVTADIVKKYIEEQWEKEK